MAKVCIANGDLAAADKEFDAALAELENYPAPLVAWKVQAARARLELQMGDVTAAQEARERALEIVNLIAANVADEKLRTTFLDAATKEAQI